MVILGLLCNLIPSSRRITHLITGISTSSLLIAAIRSPQVKDYEYCPTLLGIQPFHAHIIIMSSGIQIWKKVGKMPEAAYGSSNWVGHGGAEAGHFKGPTAATIETFGLDWRSLKAHEQPPRNHARAPSCRSSRRLDSSCWRNQVNHTLDARAFLEPRPIRLE